jgi:hypothetical protein
MAFQFSTTDRNAAGDAIETSIGVSPILKFRSGAVPANCAAADSGTVLATLNLPSDWLSAGAAGVKSMLGTWQDTAADAAGTIGHFRIYDSGGVTCRIQGTVTATGGGGDVIVDNTSIAVGQPINVTAFSYTVGGA